MRGQSKFETMETIKGIWETIKQQLSQPDNQNKQLALIPVRR